MRPFIVFGSALIGLFIGVIIDRKTAPVSSGKSAEELIAETQSQTTTSQAASKSSKAEETD
jgi:hypothetical protein